MKRLGFLLSVFFMLSLPKANAATLSNDSYTVETKDINTQTTISLPTPTPVPTQPESHVKEPFVFSLSTPLLDFGEISTTNPVTRTVTLTIHLGDATGYTVFAIEDHEPTASSSTLIPDTSCDVGACNTIVSAPWESILTYGFGYRCENIVGHDCNKSFKTPVAYKRFPNRVKGDAFSSLLQGQNDTKEKQVNIVYKINTPATQEKGIYINTIQYIAIPDF